MLTVGILCGGFGTRMAEMGRELPKALMEVGGRPILGHIMETLKTIQEPYRTVLVSNDLFAGVIEEWVDSESSDQELEVLNNGVRTVDERLGSIGDMQFIVEHGVDSDLLIVGSDNLFDFSMGEFLDFARSRGPAVALFDVGDLEEAKRFGVVSLDKTGRLIEFWEKPDEPKSTLIATCIYYFPASDVRLIREYIGAGENTDKSGFLISWMIERKPVFGCEPEGRWFDIGNSEVLEEARKFFRDE